MTSERVSWSGWPVVVRSARTAVAAVVSVFVARLFRLQEFYWAPLTTLVITQSSFGAALAVSWQRFVGTLLGAVVGAIVASYFGSDVLVFAATVFILGLVSGLLRSDQASYRFGSIALAIVMLVPRTDAPWRVAFHRFAEVTIGIVVALALAVLWPEKDIVPLQKK